MLQVYETVETILLNQDEAMNISVQPTSGGEMKTRFKKLSLIFGGKNKSSTKAEETPEEKQPFSIFSKKPPKPVPSPSGSVDNDWTIV